MGGWIERQMNDWVNRLVDREANILRHGLIVGW